MNAWWELERGQPLKALRLWRSELHIDTARINLHLEAAKAGLATDPLSPLRQQALKLLSGLAAHQPGETEISQLGELLRGWGELCLSHAPSRALQQFERAWACGSDALLERQLANLYARQGMTTGAHALSTPARDLAPWPQASCAGLQCQPCQEAAATEPLPAEPALQIHSIPGGQIWIERNCAFEETYGLAVAEASGALIPELCRRYPWYWPRCTRQSQHLQQSLTPLALRAPSTPLRVKGSVLAVADLSAELYYHGQLELLPRLGRSWQELTAQVPNLFLWQNGGSSPWLQQAIHLLGVPPNRQICAKKHPQLQADLLLVPSFPNPFGQPGLATLAWLRQFWQTAVQNLSTPINARRWLLLRPHQQRRPLLQHQDWQNRLKPTGWNSLTTETCVLQQLASLMGSDEVIAVHGGAMTNLLLAPAETKVVELANPDYTPPYFSSLIRSGRLRHQRQIGAPTPQLLQDLLYAGPLEWPIDQPS